MISNHAKLINDVCNPSPTQNIDGIQLTQTELTRVNPAMRQHVDLAFREVARRLLGKGCIELLDSSHCTVSGLGSQRAALTSCAASPLPPEPASPRIARCRASICSSCSSTCGV